MEKITIIGHFGGNTNMLDGQTIKTKTLYTELKKNTNWKIYKVDTYYCRHNPIRFLWDSSKGIIGSHNIIVLLSKGGMRVCFPILYYASKLFHKNIFHDVIGGKLPEYVKDIPNFHKYISSFKIREKEILIYGLVFISIFYLDIKIKTLYYRDKYC